ncbi:hypothetical protein Bhyg_05623 [Pseudolycoriella hygida]|uniref:Uncharacterized protein n=1 Tax=Pseudolycoriella hygida TaxID=35572 RepID=A0A9Q0S071_9DIPT|nr:hypothetical protein Bhyg_05623 [Pseudolycoriella hygida]
MGGSRSNCTTEECQRRERNFVLTSVTSPQTFNRCIKSIMCLYLLPVSGFRELIVKSEEEEAVALVVVKAEVEVVYNQAVQPTNADEAKFF